MAEEGPENRFPIVGDGSGLESSDNLYQEEVRLALRNRGMPLEAQRYDITPTGLHYLLIHYDIPAVAAGEWRLEVAGAVSTPLQLTYEEIRQRPSQTLAVTMECAGNGRALLSPRHVSQPWFLEAIGTAEWTGVPLRGILEEARLLDEAVEIVFTALDQGVEGDQVQYYQRSLSVAEATMPEVLLAYEMNGEPLQPQHGYPLRLVVPGWYGMTSVKWLRRIEAVTEPFHGFQMEGAYRYAQSADEEGEAVTLIRVRALMIPPGIPHFLTRARLVQAGPVTLSGRAWAGRSEVVRVEVSQDGGSTWSEAQLSKAVSPRAWREWTYPWNARPGKVTLCVRATDSQGNVQPIEPYWTQGGYGNNMVQRVDVIVE